MKGSVIIDGNDIGDLGMFILKGGDYDFLPFPDRVEPEQNEWHEQDGVDADLSEVYFKEKKVVVRFYIKAETAGSFFDRLTRLYRIISAPGYRQLYSREFGKSFSLRFISCPGYNHRGGMYKEGVKRGEIDVEFSMDDPLQLFTDFENLIPRNGRHSKTYVSINGYDLSEFGIIVNQCYNTVLRLPTVKVPLIRNIRNRNGLIVYPSAETTFEKKQTVIDCTMTADNREDFYFNYGALFNHMRMPGSIALSTYAFDDSLCYYSAMQNFVKVRPFGSRILVRFSLVFTHTQAGLFTTLLGTEDDVFAVVTESGEYFIEV